MEVDDELGVGSRLLEEGQGQAETAVVPPRQRNRTFEKHLFRLAELDQGDAGHDEVLALKDAVLAPVGQGRELLGASSSMAI